MTIEAGENHMQTNNIRLSIESGRDGGLSVHEYAENNEPIHVFSGDVKQAGEYLLARCTKLATKEPARPAVLEGRGGGGVIAARLPATSRVVIHPADDESTAA